MLKVDKENGYLNIIANKVNNDKCFEYLFNQISTNSNIYHFGYMNISFNCKEDRFEISNKKNKDNIFKISIVITDVDQYVTKFLKSNKPQQLLKIIKKCILKNLSDYSNLILTDNTDDFKKAFSYKLINQFDYYDVDFLINLIKTDSKNKMYNLELDDLIMSKIYEEKIIIDIFSFKNYEKYYENYLYNVLCKHKFHRYGSIDVESILEKYDHKLLYKVFDDMFNDESISNSTILGNLSNITSYSELNNIILKDTIIIVNKNNFKINNFNEKSDFKFVLNDSRIFMNHIFKEKSNLDMFTYSSYNNGIGRESNQDTISIVEKENVFFTSEKYKKIKDFYTKQLVSELSHKNLNNYYEIVEVIKEIKIIDSDLYKDKRIINN